MDRGGGVKVLSLGAGVQSSTLALMAAHGEVEMPDCAIFADTGHEPTHSQVFDPATKAWITGGVYGWLDWLEKRLPFPVYRVKKGNLFDAAAVVRVSKKSGKRYMKGLIPAFVAKNTGGVGLLGRLCTQDYKIVPIQQKVRELAGAEITEWRRRRRTDAGSHLPPPIEMWIGISRDEVIRMKPSRKKYIEHKWPLIDAGKTRDDCLLWLDSKGYPRAPRSACRGCPFHSDAEWARLKNESPEDFALAVAEERRLHAAAAAQNALDGVPFLHGSCKPLDEVDFSFRPGMEQLDLFGNECEGLCGV